MDISMYLVSNMASRKTVDLFDLLSVSLSYSPQNCMIDQAQGDQDQGAVEDGKVGIHGLDGRLQLALAASGLDPDIIHPELSQMQPLSLAHDLAGK